MRERCVTRTIGCLYTISSSNKLFLRTSNRGVWSVPHSTRTLRFISLLFRLKAVYAYASHTAFRNVLAIVCYFVTQTPLDFYIKTARRLGRSRSLRFTTSGTKWCCLLLFYQEASFALQYVYRRLCTSHIAASQSSRCQLPSRGQLYDWLFRERSDLKKACLTPSDQIFFVVLVSVILPSTTRTRVPVW